MEKPADHPDYTIIEVDINGTINYFRIPILWDINKKKLAKHINKGLRESRRD